MSSNFIILFSSVLIGAVFAYLIKDKIKWQKLLLVFSAGFLLGINCLEIFPTVYTSQIPWIGAFVLAGVLIQFLMESVSKGAEHGHFHHPITWALVLGLFIHEFIEGMPITQESTHQHFLWAVVIHKIPLSMILTLFLLHTKKSKWFIVCIVFLFALTSPLGSLFGNYWLKDYHTQLMAIVSGIFLHISSVIIFENSEDHRFNLTKLMAVLLGIFLAVLLVSS